ncbi:MAG: hypothetical protein HUK22_02600, partial [Thermoguttaceae bacterium]|nr:hypothetical protein [Thermoguttaceae bacterium]
MSLKREKDENPFAPPIDEDFLQTALEYRDNFENEEDFQEALAIWPRCPQCGRRRVVKCSVCGTSGTLFQLGDREFWDFRSEEERARDVELIDEAERRQTALRDDHCCGECDCETADAPESSLDGQLIPGARDWRRSPRRCGCGKRSNVFDDVPDARPRRAWAELGKNREDAPDEDDDATPTAPTP